MNRKDRRTAASKSHRETRALAQQTAAPQSADAALTAAQKLFAARRADAAQGGLAQACARHPEHAGLAAAHAYALAAVGRISDAVSAYRRALTLAPDQAGLLTNLAFLLMRSGELDEAVSLLERSRALAPGHANVSYALAELACRQKRTDDAETHYRRAVEHYRARLATARDATAADDAIKLGTALGWLGNLRGSLAAYDQALGLCRDHPLALSRKGLALVRLRRYREAADVLRRAARIEPNSAQVRRALGDLYLEIGQSDRAERYYATASKLDPNDPMAAYFLAAARQETPDAPPPAYVESLFDDYARNFEEHLVKVLRYRAPEFICKAVFELATPPADGWDVIDLGCGTGLCGPLIRPAARRLVGVDLASQMLDKAREKALYDELRHADIVATLDDEIDSFDLVLCADVLVYLGNLQPVFAAVHRALRAGGWFAFTTETADDITRFSLETTGRYRHAPEYVRASAREAGFELLLDRPFVARYQSEVPVYELLCVLRRKPHPA